MVVVGGGWSAMMLLFDGELPTLAEGRPQAAHRRDRRYGDTSPYSNYSSCWQRRQSTTMKYTYRVLLQVINKYTDTDLRFLFSITTMLLLEATLLQFSWSVGAYLRFIPFPKLQAALPPSGVVGTPAT